MPIKESNPGLFVVTRSSSFGSLGYKGNWCVRWCLFRKRYFGSWSRLLTPRARRHAGPGLLRQGLPRPLFQPQFQGLSPSKKSPTPSIACPIWLNATNRTTKPINITTKKPIKLPPKQPFMTLLFPADSLSRWIANCIGDGSDMVCFLDWGEY